MVLPRNAPRDISLSERRRRSNPTWQSDWNAAQARSGRKAVTKKLSKTAPVTDMPWPERLRADMNRGMEIYQEKLGVSDIFAEDDPLVRQKRIDAEHRTYAKGMIKAALRPIREDFRKNRTNAVMKSIGLGVGMWLVSPGFRQEVLDLPKNTLRDMDEHIRGRIEARVEAKTAQGKRVGPFLQMRYDRIMKAKDGGHAPYSDHSAAVTVLGLNDAYYDKLREPGVDREKIKARYEEGIQTLYTKAAKDGVDPVQVDANVRYLTGQRMANDPSYAIRHAHTAHGILTRTNPVRMTSTDEHGNTVTVERWDGQFKHFNGGVVKTSDPGYFVPRYPADMQEHATNMAAEIGRDFGSATDAAGLQRKFFAWAAVQHDSFDTFSEETKANGSDYETNILSSFDNMIEMMGDDGLNEIEAHTAFTHAFTSAFAQVGEKNPELMKEWVNEYGADWDVRLGIMIQDMEHGDLYVKEAHLESNGDRKTVFEKDREQGVAGKVEQPVAEQPVAEQPIVASAGEEPQQGSRDPFEEIMSRNFDSSSDVGGEMDFDDAAMDAFGADGFGADDFSAQSSVIKPSSRPKPVRAAAQRQARQQAQEREQAESVAHLDADNDGVVTRDEQRENGVSSTSSTSKIKGRSGLMAEAVRQQARQQARQKARQKAISEQKASTPPAPGAHKLPGKPGAAHTSIDLPQVRTAELTPAEKAAAARRAARANKNAPVSNPNVGKKAPAKLSPLAKLQEQAREIDAQVRSDMAGKKGKDDGPSL